MLPRLALTFALAVLIYPGAAHAQAQPPTPQPAVETQQYDTPAYVAVVDGSATLERDGRIENAPLNMPLLSGDRLRTTDGRLEVRFADGGRLHLDARTSLDMLSDDLVRLGDGRIRLAIQRAPQVSYRVDSAAGSVRITEAGEYRIALIPGERETQLELAVVRGAAEIFTDQGSTPVRSGERAYASAGLMPSYSYAYNSANLDEFDRWSEMQRGTVYAASSQSSQYLPADMGGYASTFDQYGDWRYQQTYGYVWYPRVSVGWRPYYYGRWAPYPSYGWTWIAGDSFGYPTHHYGRWGFSAGTWFWIPRSHWAPAYVSWGYAPSYVSWCPLGWNNAAVFSIGFYNVGPAYYAGHYRGNYYSAWTTVPHGYFGRGYYAHQHAVNWDRTGYTGARPQFTEARVGPATRDVAVPRSSTGVQGARSNVEARNTTPLRYAGTRGVNGGGGLGNGARTPETPRFINRGDQIVRSQTERPTPPRAAPLRETQGRPEPGRGTTGAPGDMAVSRTAPQFAPRDGRAADHPAYRPSPSAGDTTYRSYDRAIARTPDATTSFDGRSPQMAPRTDENVGGARAYTRPSPGDRVYPRPYAGDRVYQQPSIGDRAYERPSAGDRAYDRPFGGRVDPGPSVERAAPAPAAGPRPMERYAPAAPATGRAVERAAPAPPPAAAPRPSPGGQSPPSRNGGGGGGGGDRAVPRGGGSAPAPRGGRSR